MRASETAGSTGMGKDLNRTVGSTDGVQLKIQISVLLIRLMRRGARPHALIFYLFSEGSRLEIDRSMRAGWVVMW